MTTGPPGGTRVSFTASQVGNEGGQSVLSQVQERPMDVCVAPSGKWGDTNDGGTVTATTPHPSPRSLHGLPSPSAEVCVDRYVL